MTVVADNPACMMPDGGDCCPQYRAMAVENSRLREALKQIADGRWDERVTPSIARKFAREVLRTRQ